MANPIGPMRTIDLEVRVERPSIDVRIFKPLLDYMPLASGVRLSWPTAAEQALAPADKRLYLAHALAVRHEQQELNYTVFEHAPCCIATWCCLGCVS